MIGQGLFVGLTGQWATTGRKSTLHQVVVQRQYESQRSIEVRGIETRWIRKDGSFWLGLAYYEYGINCESLLNNNRQSQRRRLDTGLQALDPSGWVISGSVALLAAGRQMRSAPTKYRGCRGGRAHVLGRRCNGQGW